MKLRDIAHSRTGDKGDTSNISVILYNPNNYNKVSEFLTVDKIFQQLMPAMRHFDVENIVVERFDLPSITAFNFVIRKILKGGVTRSISLDAHGKSLCSVILDMDISL